jgi:catechol 2,3-dioxygenase-like lactoylglutathione lyase family enzyme
MPAKLVAAGVHFAGVAPHFRVRDVVRTAEYYREVLGFELAGYWDGGEIHHDASRPALFGIVRRDEVALHFNRAQAASIQPAAADGAYDAYFDVTHLDDLADDLRSRGAQILEGPEERIYGRRELIIRDCDGRVLAFGEVPAATAT